MGAKIIISRTDSIGDVILTLPVAGVLKQLFPECTISFLCNSYTKAIVNTCEYVDSVLDWTEIQKMNQPEQIEFFNQLKADIFIHVFPVKEIARVIRKTQITMRIGTTNRVYHWLTCNKRIRLSRKNSTYHESQLNLKLLITLGAKTLYRLDEISSLYGFIKVFPLKEKYQKFILKEKFNLVLHPKSKGSSKEWGLENFSKLIKSLPAVQFNIFITGTEKDGEEINRSEISHFQNVTNLTGSMSLDELISFISQADGLIAASTGPLHIAAALGKIAIGLYPSLRPIHAGRWAPVGKHASFLEEDKSNYDREGILQIPVEQVKKHLLSEIKKFNK